ncbi:hypothetical protein AA12717_3717 [Gluconacetobacter sacchari DSM 12717]|uniref:Uncharacterized protein n=1 Tax=Gluconacetobacter sacchari DSM 12717 TaxID=1307940 RepID=A0ABQ0PC48_9PROT|nr:hypothetical protein AA12717_3717 [Gluconacetobacter sacchari DSM 12717]
MLKGKKVDRGITNVRHTGSSWWRRWLGVEHRCLVPLTAFAEPEHLPDGGSRQVWFARANGEPRGLLRRAPVPVDISQEAGRWRDDGRPVWILDH